MAQICSKLKDRKGASITFALLIFLVCSIVSIVVIVASTTASGRLKNIPEIDRRYYAVSSAAELLSSTLDGGAVSVKVDTITTQKCDLEGKAVGDTPAPTTTQTYYYDGNIIENPSLTPVNGDPTDYSLLMNAATKLMTADTTDTYLAREKLSLTASAKTGLTLPGIDAAAALEPLSVTIYEELEKTGTLTFYVSRPVDDKNAYTLRLTFAVDRSESTTTHTDYDTPKREEDGKYTITETNTESKTTLFKWTLIGIVKDVVPEGLKTL